MSKDVVLILSGGLDSSTLLYKLLNEGNNVTALSFNYGQKAAIEIERAAEICKMNDVPHFVFDIQNIVDLLSSSLTIMVQSRQMSVIIQTPLQSSWRRSMS